MSADSPVLSLRDRLVRDDKIIQAIIDTIPPKHYFDSEVLDKLEESKVKTGNEESRGLHPRNKFGIRAKHKRLRLNPLHQKTVSQIVGELEERDKKAVEHDISPKGNIEELQQKLRNKIKVMTAERQGSKNKQAQRVKRNIAKLKQTEKHKKKKYSVTKPNASTNSDSSNGNATKSLPSPNIFNKDGKLIYSKFDLGGSSNITDPKQKKPKMNLKRSMMELKHREEKIQKLEKESSEKADEFKNKNLWQQALNKSEGRKVRDNPELLKKSLKRQEQRKKKNKKQWQHRNEQVEKKKQERQDKRTKNIQNRKHDKLNKKLKRASKKGRLIPGF